MVKNREGKGLKTIGLLGFSLVMDESIAKAGGGFHANENYEALKVLKEVISPQLYGELIKTII